MASVTKDSTIRVGERSKFSIYATSGRVITYLLVSINTAGGIVTLFDSSGAIMSSTPNLATVSGTISATLSGTIVWVIKETGNIDVTTSTTTCYGIDTTWVSQQIGMWSNDVGTLCKGIDINGNQKINKWSKFKPVRNPNIQIGGSNIWSAGADAPFLTNGAGINHTKENTTSLVGGSGLTVNIVVSNNIITSVAIVAAGTNYNVGDIVTITGAGTGALVEIADLSNYTTGTVSVLELISSGTGYLTANGLATVLKPSYGTVLGRTSGVNVRSFFKGGTGIYSYGDSALGKLASTSNDSWTVAYPRGKTPLDYDEVYRLGDYRGYNQTIPFCSIIKPQNLDIGIQQQLTGEYITENSEYFKYSTPKNVPGLLTFSDIVMYNDGVDHKLSEYKLTCITQISSDPSDMGHYWAKTMGNLSAYNNSTASHNEIIINPDFSDHPGPNITIFGTGDHEKFGNKINLIRWYVLTKLAIPAVEGLYNYTYYPGDSAYVKDTSGNVVTGFWAPYEHVSGLQGDPVYYNYGLLSENGTTVLPPRFTNIVKNLSGTAGSQAEHVTKLERVFYDAVELPVSAKSYKANSISIGTLNKYTCIPIQLYNHTGSDQSFKIQVWDKRDPENLILLNEITTGVVALEGDFPQTSYYLQINNIMSANGDASLDYSGNYADPYTTITIVTENPYHRIYTEYDHYSSFNLVTSDFNGIPMCYRTDTVGFVGTAQSTTIMSSIEDPYSISILNPQIMFENYVNYNTWYRSCVRLIVEKAGFQPFIETTLARYTEYLSSPNNYSMAINYNSTTIIDSVKFVQIGNPYTVGPGQCVVLGLKYTKDNQEEDVWLLPTTDYEVIFQASSFTTSFLTYTPLGTETVPLQAARSNNITISSTTALQNAGTTYGFNFILRGTNPAMTTGTFCLGITYTQ